MRPERERERERESCTPKLLLTPLDAQKTVIWLVVSLDAQALANTSARLTVNACVEPVHLETRQFDKVCLFVFFRQSAI